MPGWDSYRAVYGVELRAAALEFVDHGWPVVEESATSLLLITGSALDVLEVPAACGRHVCAQLRAAGAVVPVAATPTGSWWFPIATGGALTEELSDTAGVAFHTAGASVLAPPSQVPDGWVHWRVAPALTGYRVPPPNLIVDAAADAVRWRADRELYPGTQRPAGAMAVGLRF